MLTSAAPTAFLATTDLDRAHRFFADTLGLQPRAADGFAVSLTTGPIELRVTLVDTLTPAPHTVFGWRVSDLDATIDALTARGVEFVRYAGMAQDERGAWTAPGGARIAWFTDPDGNTLSLTQDTPD